MFSRRVINPTSKRAFFSNTAILAFVGLIGSVLVLPTVGNSAASPVITSPTFTSLLTPNVPAQDAGDFVVSGYEPEMTVRASLVLRNAPAGSTFSIGVTTGLALAATFTSWTSVSELTFTGNQSSVNAGLASLTMNTPNLSGVADLELTVSEEVVAAKAAGDGDMAFNPENGHYYQFISAPAIRAENARIAARGKTYLGLNGYLVTITSETENEFVKMRIQNAINVWIAASDAQQEGVWRWVEGPEAGTIFWRVAGGTQTYAKWANAEPNDWGSGEDYAVTNWGSANGLWNDLANSSSNISGYVVEFSGVSASAPELVTQNFRYTIGIRVEPTAEVQRQVEYVTPTECAPGTLAAVGGTCVATVVASSDTERVQTDNCDPAGPCTVPTTSSGGVYRYDVEFSKTVPTLDTVRYTPEGMQTSDSDRTCQMPTSSSTLCVPTNPDLPAGTFTTERLPQTSPQSTTTIPLPGADTPPPAPGVRPAQQGVEAVVSGGGGGGGGATVLTQPVIPTPDNRPPTQPRREPINTPVNPALTPPAPLSSPAPTNGTSSQEATVRGEVVEIQTSSASDQELAVTLGEDIRLKFLVPLGSGEVNNNSGTPQLQVKRDKTVSLEGDVMLPGSTVQVWFIGATESFELGRMTVAEDGLFSGDVSFGASPDGTPLPIGPQVIQITGVDREGNQTVINLNVDIDQPELAPELFRGQIVTPQPGFGNFEASNAGLPELATLTAVSAEKQALIEGNGWGMSLQLSSEGSGITENGDGVFLTFARGEAATYGGTGFMPGTIASIWLFSEPTKLGEVTIAADGTFSGITAPIDEVIEVGEHTIQVQAVGADGYIRSANLGVVVSEPVAAAAAPFAFFDWAPLALLGLLLLAGAFFIIAARRRKRSDGSNVIQFPQAA